MRPSPIPIFFLHVASWHFANGCCHVLRCLEASRSGLRHARLHYGSPGASAMLPPGTALTDHPEGN